MSTLIIIAMAVFMNGAGDTDTAMEPMHSVQECAEVLNDHHVVQTPDGDTWYMVKAACVAGVVNKKGEIDHLSPLPENWK